MTRDLLRRVARLEASDPRIVLLWLGERDRDKVMREAFGTTEAPPGVRVYLLHWADERQERPAPGLDAPPH